MIGETTMYRGNPDEHEQATMSLRLGELIKRMEVIAGEWDGDDSGDLEDKAHIATDIIESAKKLNTHLEEMVEYIDVGNA